MGQQDLLQELIRASEVGELDETLAWDDLVIDQSLLESLKKEVDYYIRSNAQLALKRAELAHWLSLRTTDLPARALGLRAKAQALHILGRYAEAIELYEAARHIYQAQNKQVEAARVARAMVDALMYLGRYEEALMLADDARQTFVANDERLLAAQLETNVGNIHHRLDQYYQALACYERAGEVFAAAGDLTAQAVIAFNSANIHSNLDEFRQAQSLYQQAHELYRAQEMELAATQVRYSLGYLHFLRGEYHQAMHVLHQVREILLRLEDIRMVALCELDLAEIYLQLNVHQEAAELAASARERFRTLAMRYEAAKALTYQGLAFLQQGKLTETEQALHAAQQEFAQEGNEVHLGLVCIYLAELSLKCNKSAEALSYAAEAQQIFARQNLRAKTGYAQLISARALMLGGETNKARELSESVLEGSRELEVPWLKYQAHDLLGDALLEAADLRGAHEQYAQSVAFIESTRAGIRVDEFRGAFFKDKLRVYKKMIRLCLNQGGPDGKAEAFFYLESCKARTLVDMLINELEVMPASDDETQAETYREWQRLREELHWYWNKTTQYQASGKSRSLARDDKLQEEISVRERALTNLARRAQIQDPHFVWLQNSAGPTAAEVRDALADDETVVEYYLDDDGLKVFVLSKHELNVVENTCSRLELKGLILELKFQLEKFHYGSTYIAAHQKSLLAHTNACLQELYQALFAPIASLVEGKKLIFIPFDLLHYVPFQALYDGEAYLLDRHEVSYAPSARLHIMTARRNELKAGTPRALILGVPDEAAPHITEEINAIRELFPEASCFIGDAASARALAEHLPTSDIVHIASHAVFRRDNPMFSAIKLSGAWLNFYDICSLRAPGALVVLSGCRTGVGRISAGDEIFGLMRGFLYAGAASLLVSLWAVNDPATAELMKVFYQRLREGCHPRPALREATLLLKKQYEHPYYWAPFVITGRNDGVRGSEHCG